ncbi:hypothetical protein DITRI_Ditri20bG0139400 [Diplodiscus trichospermus]
MFSISLDRSLFGLLNYMLANLMEFGVFPLFGLIVRGRASNLFEIRNLDYMQFLQKIQHRKNQLASYEMELDSLRKKFPELKNFTAARSSKHTTRRNNQFRLKSDLLADFSADSIVKHENLFSKFRKERASSSNETVKKFGVIIIHPRNEGKVVLQATEAEQLNRQLKILEQKNENLKQTFLKTVVESKKLVNEVCQLFHTLSFCLKDQEDVHISRYGSLTIQPSKDGGTATSGLSQVLLENPSVGDDKANVLAILGQKCTSTHINLHCN